MSITQSTTQGTEGAGSEYLAFTLGSEEYGIDILKVQEIRGYEAVTRIANAPEFIKGVINLRGIIIPVVDMRIKFKLGTPTYDQFTVVIILNIAGRGQVLKVRGEYLPLIALHGVFGIASRATDPADGIVVILESEGKRAALLIDDLVGQQHVVVKNLESNYRKVPGISGATILGDGGVSLILDVAALVRASSPLRQLAGEALAS